MLDDSRKSLAIYRSEKAAECYAAAKMAYDNDSLPTAINRSYYCIFHAMRAVLSLESFDSAKHSGIISVFRQHYIKTGIFTVELSDIIERAFKMRNKSDYDDFFVISREDVIQQIEDAKVFLEAVEAHIKPIDS